jgi:hypothetical protein
MTPAVGAPQLVISRTRSVHAAGLSKIAPYGEGYSAEMWGFASTNSHEIDVQWDYGDPTSQFLYSPSYHPLRKSSAEGDANTSWGQDGGHVFRAGGTFAVTATGYDYAGNSATSNTLTETILDPTSQTRTDLYVDPELRTGDVPGGALLYATVAAAKAAMPGGGFVRMLLHDDEEFDESENLSHPNLHVIRYGGGTNRPIVRRLRISGGTRNVIAGVQLLCEDYDSTNPTGYPSYSNALDLRGGVTVDHCVMAGSAITIGFGAYTETVINDCVYEPGNEFGSLDEDAYMSRWINVHYEQHVHTVRRPSEGNFFTHHNARRSSQPLGLRRALSGNSAIQLCYWPASEAWILSSLGGYVNWASQSAQTMNQFLRWASGGALGGRLCVSQCYTEGSAAYVGATANPNASFAGQACYERNYINVLAGKGALSTGVGGAWFKQNHVCIKDTPEEGDPLSQYMSVKNDYNTNTGKVPRWATQGLPYQVPIGFEWNTIDDQRAGANAPPSPVSLTSFQNFLQVSARANLISNPGCPGGSAPTNLTVLADEAEPRYRGRVVWNEATGTLLGTGYYLQEEFSAEGTGRMLQPQADSSAVEPVGLPTGYFPRFDMKGLPRTQQCLGCLAPEAA